MLSHASRANGLRRQSLLQLEAAGIEPLILESTYAGEHTDAEVRRRGYDALQHHHPDLGLLFFEDDIVVNAALFKRHLELAIAAQRVVAFCALNRRHYQAGVIGQPRLPVRLDPIPGYSEDRGFHGSQALYLPADLCRFGLEHPEMFMAEDGGPLTQPAILPDHLRGKVCGFDFWIKHHAALVGGILAAIPNSVDHVGMMKSGAYWRSPTYGTPTKPA